MRSVGAGPLAARRGSPAELSETSGLAPPGEASRHRAGDAPLHARTRGRCGAWRRRPALPPALRTRGHPAAGPRLMTPARDAMLSGMNHASAPDTDTTPRLRVV